MAPSNLSLTSLKATYITAAERAYKSGRAYLDTKDPKQLSTFQADAARAQVDLERLLDKLGMQQAADSSLALFGAHRDIAALLQPR